LFNNITKWFKSFEHGDDNRHLDELIQAVTDTGIGVELTA
jgi:hypothetical protein